MKKLYAKVYKVAKLKKYDVYKNYRFSNEFHQSVICENWKLEVRIL